jgi:glycosyltransferase involved in cell wall biosynthesis
MLASHGSAAAPLTAEMLRRRALRASVREERDGKLIDPHGVLTASAEPARTTSLSKRVLFLPRHDTLAASCRHRITQYVPYLRERGFDCTISPFFSNHYVEVLVNEGRKSSVEVARGAARRVMALLSAGRQDLLVIQSELFPYFPPLVERLLRGAGIPYVLDFDDAFFHTYDQHQRHSVRWLLGDKIAEIIRGARMNMAGSPYLAEYARKCGGRVEVVPTVVDLNRYPRAPTIEADPQFRIGWIGTPSTTPHLQSIAGELRAFCETRNARLIAVGARPFDFPGLPIEWVEWSEETEVQQLSRFDVGIMPLPDTPWTRGKCGFKLIQYMACWTPVVASAVGANCHIVEHTVSGFLAQPGEWGSALATLCDDVELRRRMGLQARRAVKQKYSLQVWAPRVATLLSEAVLPQH